MTGIGIRVVTYLPVQKIPNLGLWAQKKAVFCNGFYTIFPSQFWNNKNIFRKGTGPAVREKNEKRTYEKIVRTF